MPTATGKKVGSIRYTEILAPLPIGNTGVYDVTILKDNAAFNLTGSTVFFTAKYDAEDYDVDAPIKYDSINEPANIAIDIGVNGTLTLTVSSVDTDLVDVGDLFCDIKVRDTLGEFFTHLFFILPMCQRITRRETT